jgi:hypothetical protein
VSAPSAVSFPTSSRCSRWRLKRLDDRAEPEYEHRHADQHDQPEDDRRRDEDRAHDDVGDERPCETRRDVERAARSHRVIRDGGDDLTGREGAADRRPGPGRVVRDELGQAKRRLQPVEDRVAVAHHAGERLHQAEHEQRQRPDGKVAVRALDDPELDRAADRKGHQRLGEHPPDPEEDPERERALLVASDPQQEPQRRARVGRAGVGDRYLDRFEHGEERAEARRFNDSDEGGATSLRRGPARRGTTTRRRRARGRAPASPTRVRGGGRRGCALPSRRPARTPR